MVSSLLEVSLDTGSTARTTATRHKRTTITPFEKVLKDTTTEQTKQTSAAEKASSTDASTSSIKVPKKLESIFKKASEQYGVPYNFLVAVAKAESDFQVNCTSKSGAMGIMQLMPATAKSLGVKNAYDPEENIMGGAKYLAAHLKTFNGDTDLAAAAYNAGGAAVKKYGGIPPYSETQNYVKIINKYMKQGVTVPDKTVNVATSNDTTAVAPSDATVVVGSGDGAVTMTYEAYKRYLELGTTGVG